MNSVISFGGKTHMYRNSKISGRTHKAVTVVISGLWKYSGFSCFPYLHFLKFYNLLLLKAYFKLNKETEL